MPTADDTPTITAALWFCPRCGARHVTRETCPDDGVEVIPLGQGDDLSGTVLKDKYVLVQRLGQGSYGAVYRAWHRLARTELAVKVLLDEVAADPAARRDFLKEARILMQLSSPRIVTMRDVDQDDRGRLFLVMDLLDGQDLREHLRGLKDHGAWVDLPTALEIGRQVAEGLAVAHARGVVHRDLKPSNLHLQADGGVQVRLLDFGIARLVAPDGIEASLPTRNGVLKGTAAYMSPEQCRCAPVDARADLYALGVVLYELVTGRRPFQTPTIQAALLAHLTETPSPPSQVSTRNPIPQDLERLILDLLQKDPDQRPGSATEVADRLGRIQASLASGARVGRTSSHQAPAPVERTRTLEDGRGGISASGGPSQAAGGPAVPTADTGVPDLPGSFPRRGAPWRWPLLAVLALVLMAGIAWVLLQSLRGPSESAPAGAPPPAGETAGNPAATPSVPPNPGPAVEAPGDGSPGPRQAEALPATTPAPPTVAAPTPATADRPSSSEAPPSPDRPRAPTRPRTTPEGRSARASPVPPPTQPASPAPGSTRASAGSPDAAPTTVPTAGVRPASRIDLPDESEMRDPSRGPVRPGPASRPLPTEDRARGAFDELDQVLQRGR